MLPDKWKRNLSDEAEAAAAKAAAEKKQLRESINILQYSKANDYIKTEAKDIYDKVNGLFILKDSVGTSGDVIAELLDHRSFSEIQEDDGISTIKDASVGKSKDPTISRIQNGFNLDSEESSSRAAIPCYTMPYYTLRNDVDGSLQGIIFVMYIPEKTTDSDDVWDDLSPTEGDDELKSFFKEKNEIFIRKYGKG